MQIENTALCLHLVVEHTKTPLVQILLCWEKEQSHGMTFHFKVKLNRSSPQMSPEVFSNILEKSIKLTGLTSKLCNPILRFDSSPSGRLNCEQFQTHWWEKAK